MNILNRISTEAIEVLPFSIKLYFEYRERGLSYKLSDDFVTKSFALINDIKKHPAFKGTEFEKATEDFYSWWQKGGAFDARGFISRVKALLLIKEAVLADCRLNNNLKQL